MKKIAFIFILIFLSIVGMISVNKTLRLPETPTKEKLIDFFNNKKPVFENITAVLKNIEGDVSIDKRNGKGNNPIAEISTKNGVEPLAMDEIKNDVDKLLYQFGFVDIYKESDFIYFDKSVEFQSHQALVYSISEKEPPLHRERDFMKIGNGWYYYNGE